MSPDDLFKRPFPDENYIPPDEADLRKQALQKAYEIAQSITTEQNKPVATKPPVDRGPLLRAANAALAVLVALWLLAAPPEWLPQRTPDRRTAEQRELGLRMVLAVEAARVTAYRDAQGQLPATLADAGSDARSVTYVVVDAGRFRLTATDGPATLSYDSADPLAALLGGTAGRP
jgi:hypothetical protein